MTRSIQLLALSGIVLFTANCGNMNDVVYHDPNFMAGTAKADQSEEASDEVAASTEESEATLAAPSTDVVNESEVAAAATTASKQIASTEPAPVATPKPTPRPPSNGDSPFIQPDVYGIPSNQELKETSQPINSGGNSRRLSVPSDR